MNTEVTIQEQPYGFNAFVKVYYERTMREAIDAAVVKAIQADVALQVSANSTFKAVVIQRATERLLELLK